MVISQAVVHQQVLKQHVACLAAQAATDLLAMFVLHFKE
jgi:hypothetical protein